MQELLTTTPTTRTDFRQWVKDGLALLTANAENPDTEFHQQVAALIRRTKLHAVQLGLSAIANRLPERPTKTPLDGILRLEEVLELPTALPEFLTIEEVCNYTGLSKSSVRRRVADGTFPEPTKFGRLIKWRRCEIEAL